MSFGDYILRGADVLQIKPKSIREVAGDTPALRTGLTFIVIAGAAAALGSWTLPGLIIFPLVFLVKALIHAGIVHFLAATGFGGHGTFGEFFRPLALAHLLDWVLVVGLVINIVPLLGPAAMILLALVVTIWKLVVATVIIETVYGLERTKAVAVMAIVVVANLFFGAAMISTWLVAR